MLDQHFPSFQRMKHHQRLQRQSLLQGIVQHRLLDSQQKLFSQQLHRLVFDSRIRLTNRKLSPRLPIQHTNSNKNHLKLEAALLQ